MAIDTQQLKSLPEFVQDVLTLKECNDVNGALREAYNLNDEELAALLDAVNEIVTKNVSLEDGITMLHAIRADDQFIADVLGKRLLVIDSYLDGVVREELENRDVQPKQYQKEVQRQLSAIDAYRKEQAEANEPYEAPVQAEPVAQGEVPPPDPETEKKQSVAVFQSHIVPMLQADDEDVLAILAFYNASLLSVLADEKDRSFLQKLVRALQANQERLTTKPITVKGEKKPPTVGNWLTDFVEQAGAEYVDAVALSQYLANSKNVAALTAEEKHVVRKLLQLYRNVAFFPRSMPNETGEGWEIIPLSGTLPEDDGDDDDFKTRPQPTQTQTAEETTADPQLALLKELAAQYPEGSLERRAIDEEMNKRRS